MDTFDSNASDVRAQAGSPAWRAFVFMLALALALFSPMTTRAQSVVSGDLAGTVTDSSGASVSNATVVISSKASGPIATLQTNSVGGYRLPLLKPGEYDITVTAPGFEKTALTVTVSLGSVTTGDVKLTVGQASETVEVTSAPNVLHTDSADLSTVFSMEQVQDLPNPGNDLTFVAQTAPGTVMNTQGGYGNFSSFGLPATSNTFTVNGGYENDPFLNVNNSGATNLLLGNNDVSDVSVISNAYDASFGGLGGAQINETTRSGSNKFHGNAEYFWNGRVMNANDYFNNLNGNPRPFDNVNQYAAAIGGPIKRDKTFFFFNYEGLRVILPTRSSVYAPDASYQALTLANLAANGLSSEIPGYQKIFGTYSALPGYASAPQSTTDASSGGYGTVLLNATASNFTHEYLINARIDHTFRESDHLFGHFEMDKGLQATFTSVLNPAFNAGSPQPQYQGQLNYTHTFTPSLVNQFVFSNIYYRAIFTNTNFAAATALSPFSLIFIDGDLGNNGPNAWPGGLDIIWPQGRNVEGYQFEDDLSWTKGGHTIKVGWTMRRDDVTDYSPSEYTQAPEAVITNSSFQNGYVDEWVENFPTRTTQPVALYTMGGYIQDQWKARSNLTITAGLRLEHNSNPICITNCFSRLTTDFASSNPDPTIAYNKQILSGQHSAFKSLQKIGYEPRVGIAYLPFGSGTSTTIRAGFGMFADNFPAQIADSFLNNAPGNVQFALLGPAFGGATNLSLLPSDPGSAAIAAAASNAAFTAGYASGASSSTLASVPGFSVPGIVTATPHISYPTYEEWSLSLEHQITKSAALSLTYVGNHGYHEPVVNNSVNSFYVPDTSSTDAAYDPNGTFFPGLPRSPTNPSFGASTQVYSGASSNYNGLVASLVNRGKYVTLQFNYSYSHALDEVSNGGFDSFSANSVNPSNPNNLRNNYGNADYDTRHYVSASYILKVPHWRGPEALTGGWEIGGTAFHNDGFPFSVTTSDFAGSLPQYGGAVYAQQIAPIKDNHCGGTKHALGGANSTPCSFVSDFAEPTDFGQGRRNSVYGSSYTDTDLSVSKKVQIPRWESASFKGGVQFFNLFNHPNFGQPGSNFASPDAFGYISGTVNTPTSILGAFLGGDASPLLVKLVAKFNF